MVETVIAQAILRTSEGDSILDVEQPVTPDAAERYRIDDKRTEQAREKLSEFGFEVVVAGPHSLSIKGSRNLFERVFQTRLQEVSAPELGVTPEAKSSYEAQDPIVIPDDLAPFVAAVLFPAPPKLFP